MRHALGEPAGAALEAHLAACPACSQAVAAWRGKAGQLDAALRELSAVEPPAYGPERVLARIQLQPARPFRRLLAHATLAVLVLLACLLVALRRPVRVQQADLLPVSALSTWRSPTQSLLRSPADALLKGVPRLGQGFLETKPSGEKNAQ